MDRNLALEAVRVTEAAALSCARLTGRGDEKAADQAAVDAMRKAFDALTIDGTVVIGEGERDEAPMLYIGEKVGCGGPKVDIALDPLEGTTICATGGPNALAVIAMAAAAVSCVGCEFQGRLAPRNKEGIERTKKMGVSDIKKKFTIDELAAGDVMFAATGVTDGDYLHGVHFFSGGATTQSVVMRSKTKTIRVINATHYFEHKPNY